MPIIGLKLGLSFFKNSKRNEVKIQTEKTVVKRPHRPHVGSYPNGLSNKTSRYLIYKLPIQRFEVKL
jgi:hypothetical protein